MRGRAADFVVAYESSFNFLRDDSLPIHSDDLVPNFHNARQLSGPTWHHVSDASVEGRGRHKRGENDSVKKRRRGMEKSREEVGD